MFQLHKVHRDNGGTSLITDNDLRDESDVKAETDTIPDRIVIPRECREIKAWFLERPGSEIVQEIKQHIADGGEPFAWRGHTHTKPAPGSKPVYLEEFDLPKKRLLAKRWAPCPCCTPETPKYGRDGKIAWFPSERVIRLLGPDCFRSLDKEGHEAAKRQLEIERRRKQDSDYLLSKLPLLPNLIRIGDEVTPVARALDEFRESLLEKLALDRLMLWDHVRDGGNLKFKERSQEFRRNSDGSMRVEEVEIDRVYAPLAGYEILNPARTSCAARLKSALRTLREYDYGDSWRTRLDAMDDQQRMKAAKSIGSAVTSVKTSLAKLETLRSFTNRVTINTLRGWGRHDGCPTPRFWEHQTDRITFGRSEYQNYAVPIPADLSARIGSIEF